ncbi:hypothetical protein VXQ18_08815 [Brucella abortus]|nr:hypothetical protein [Brucella abortus]
MRHRIITYIDENLTNPLLGPHSIMQHFHLSRSASLSRSSRMAALQRSSATSGWTSPTAF